MRDDGEWGEFFPMTMSAFPYNLSFAQRYFPLTEEEAKKLNLLWYERDEVEAGGAKLADDLPDELPQSDQPITILSAGNTRPFRITSAEISRYRSLKVPLPRLSYFERMEERWARLGGVKLNKRQSALSGNTLLTSMDSNLAPVLWSQEEWEREVW